MPDALDTQAVEHTARQLLDARISAVRDLATAQVAVDHARDALGVAETTHATVYAAAMRAGWSAAELKQIGLTAPTRCAPGRPRRPRAHGSATAALSSPSGGPDSTGVDAEANGNGG
jgi:hypothetical protein